MISSRWKKVGADFWGNRGRTFLTTMTIMAGAFAVGFNSNFGLYLSESMETDFLSAKPAEAYIYAHPINDETVKIVSEMPGVNGAEGFSSMSAQIIQPDGKHIDVHFTAVGKPGKLSLNVLTPAMNDIVIPQYKIKEMIMDASASSLGYKPGDTILIELENGRVREVKLAGYMHSSTGPSYTLANQVNAYVTKGTLNWLGGDASNYNQLAISVMEEQTNQEHVTQMAQMVSDRLERAGATVYSIDSSQPGHHFAYESAQGMFVVLGILGYLTVFLSAFLIVNTITALMAQHTRQIGIMKSTGASVAQITGMYLALVLGFGVVAFLIAAPLANITSQIVGEGIARWMGIYPTPYKGYPITLMQQAFITLGIPPLAAILPIYNRVKITVREALNNHGLGENTKLKKDSANENFTFIPRPINISLRNTFRRKTRLGLTLVTLILGGAIFMAVYNLWASFDRAIEDVGGYLSADINIKFDHGYRFDKLANIVKDIPGVESSEGWLEYEGTLKMDGDKAGVQMTFIAPPSSSTLIDPIIIAGRWLEPEDENAVVVGNDLLKTFPDTKIGDFITIETNGRKTNWQIVGVFSLPGSSNVHLMYANEEYLGSLAGVQGMIHSLHIITAEHDAETQNRLREQIQRALLARGIQIADIQLATEFINEQKSQTEVIVYFMLVMAGVIVIVGGLGLMGTMSINVLERTREIGVMRAIGASNGDIQSIVVLEGVLIGVFGWIISIVVALPITVLLCQGIGIAIFTSPLPVIYDISGIIVWLIFTTILAILASALPAYRASRLTVKDTLAYE
jgi:putative ABC transport system permease protein